jgi:hypothetical protein
MIDNYRNRQEYQKKLLRARENAQQEADEKSKCVYDCLLCGEDKTVVERENQYHCFFCGDTDSEAQCTRCTEIFRRSELNDYGKNEYGDTLLFCDACLAYADKD